MLPARAAPELVAHHGAEKPWYASAPDYDRTTSEPIAPRGACSPRETSWSALQLAVGVVLVAGLGVATWRSPAAQPGARQRRRHRRRDGTGHHLGARLRVSTEDAGVDVVTTSLPPPPKPVVARHVATTRGKADGRTGSVALSMRGGHATAYVCDGKRWRPGWPAR